MSVRIARGFPEAQRDRVAALFWDAFGADLSRLLAPPDRARAFLSLALRPDFALSARDAGGGVIGVAGLKTRAGGLLGGGFAQLRAAYGLAGAAWRAPLLELTDRPVAPDEVVLDGLFVACAARGRGVGTALIRAACDEAARQGATRLRLDVAEGNAAARRLYLREGFVATGAPSSGPLRHLTGMARTVPMTRPAP